MSTHIAAHEGVATIEQLKAEFDKVSRAARRAAIAPSTASFLEKLTALFKERFLPMEQKCGLIQGDDNLAQYVYLFLHQVCSFILVFNS